MSWNQLKTEGENIFVRQRKRKKKETKVQANVVRVICQLLHKYHSLRVVMCRKLILVFVMLCVQIFQSK